MSTKRIKIEAAPAEEPGQSLHTKYRPQRLADVLGQGAVVKSLEATLKSRSPGHCYLFTGPPGTGKTTLARILASEFRVDPMGIIEVDGSSKSGIDDMRALTAGLQYAGFGDRPNKAIIINECQGLSKQAWDALLTDTEEPPPHVYFFFTSTNPGKIPAPMVTRCQSYHLASVKFSVIMDLLDEVCEREGYRTPDKVLEQVAEACQGSARHALTMLAAVHDCADPEEAAVLLQRPMDNAEVIDICRMLMSRKLTWPKLIETIKGLEGTTAETVRIIVLNYLAACAMGAKNEDDAVRVLDIMEHFGKPYNTSDKWAPLLMSFGRYMFP